MPKVRGSYTVVASSFDRYLTNPGYEYNSPDSQRANPTVYPMDNLKPEKTKSWEIGLNLKFWENPLQSGRNLLSFQYFKPDI